MNNLPSIKQNARPDALPNFRNLGVILRILLFCIGLALLQAILLANAWTDVEQRMLQVATLLTPVLLTSLMLLWLAQPWLNRLPYWQGVLAVMVLAVTMTLAIYSFGGELYLHQGSDNGYFDEARYTLISMVVCGILLQYFRLRAKTLSLALHEARLQVLRARIRPHFLFNTINAVLGIVRTQPKQAETALEDMADLFRMAMAEEQDLVPLGHEIQLSKQYVALEKMRMGERLQVDWQMNGVPEDALIPPLLLQPLLENAVYHGIEPLLQGGCINIVLRHNGDRLQVNVDNPCSERVEIPHRGNMIALSNIRERLELLFDVEASYKVERGKDFYRVEIIFPYLSSVKERSI
jgi:two-component system sensor histidine kinase AlgZ